MRQTAVVQIRCSCWSLPSAELYSILEVNHSAYSSRLHSYRIHTVKLHWTAYSVCLVYCHNIIIRKLYEDKIYTDISTHHSQVLSAILALLFGYSYITACVLIHFYCCNRLLTSYVYIYYEYNISCLRHIVYLIYIYCSVAFCQPLMTMHGLTI